MLRESISLIKYTPISFHGSVKARLNQWEKINHIFKIEEMQLTQIYLTINSEQNLFQSVNQTGNKKQN